MTQSKLVGWIIFTASILLVGCGGSSATAPTPPPPVVTPPPPADIVLSGTIAGHVMGGTLRVYSSDTYLDRSTPITMVRLSGTGAGSYTLTVAGSVAESVAFVVLDVADASDQVFGDQPPELVAAVDLGAAGSELTVNVSLLSTIVVRGLEPSLDPDGDGSPVDDASVRSLLASLTDTSLGAFRNEIGEMLFAGDLHSADITELNAASAEIGRDLRRVALLDDLTVDDALRAVAADAADGTIDGSSMAMLDDHIDDALASVADAFLFASAATDSTTVSCESSSQALLRACELETLEDVFDTAAVCAHTSSSSSFAICFEEAKEEQEENFATCHESFYERIDICDATANAPHDPPFGGAFAANFVDPRNIGATVSPNPYFPLIPGSRRVYAKTFTEDDEEVTETVIVMATDRVKWIQGVLCLVVNDTVTIDDVLVEDTDDWFAQDVEGNVYYCGEEAKDYEVFDDDLPALPELVSIDGSFKAGRDGDEAGLFIPAEPERGQLIRQEVSITNAEDVVEIRSLVGTESTPAASCTATCLVTLDFTPLEPDTEELKYYAPGIGPIVEIDLETGERLELVEHNL